MAYQDLEDSIEDGRPISFYQFTLGASVAWRYTSAEEAITVGGYTWEPAAITDDGNKQTGESVNDVMTIDCPWWIGPAQLFMSAAPSKSIQVTVFAKHEGDTEIVATYIGDVTQINYPMPGRAKISCETIGASMQREGLRLGWQRTCPYSLYDPITCKVNKTAFGTTFVVQEIDGDFVRIRLTTARASNFYNNGFVEWTHPIRGLETLPVDSYVQIGSTVEGTISLLSPAGDLFVGASGTAYPGCDFTPTSCLSFSNYDNYGGAPDMPGKSPFNGNPFF